jgi:hypothetical protein
VRIERKALTALRWTAGTRLLGQAVTWVVTLALVRIRSLPASSRRELRWFGAGLSLAVVALVILIASE